MAPQPPGHSTHPSRALVILRHHIPRQNAILAPPETAADLMKGQGR